MPYPSCEKWLNDYRKMQASGLKFDVPVSEVGNVGIFMSKCVNMESEGIGE